MPQNHFIRAPDGRVPARVDITVTRADLAEVVHTAVPRVSRREARLLVDTILEEISEALLAGDHVKLHTFGSFQVRSKRERVGRNPRTGVQVAIEPRRVVTFKPSPQMRETIVRSYGDLGSEPRPPMPAEVEGLMLPAGGGPAQLASGAVSKEA